MTPINGIKIFKLNDCDWYAGADLDACITQAADDFEYTESEYREINLREPDGGFELTDVDMDRLRFIADPYAPAERKISFRTRLLEMMAEGAPFPVSFASTEY